MRWYLFILCVVPGKKEQSLFNELMTIAHDLPPLEDDWFSQFSEATDHVSIFSMVRLFRSKILDPENVVLVEMCSKEYGLADTISLKALVGFNFVMIKEA